MPKRAEALRRAAAPTANRRRRILRALPRCTARHSERTASARGNEGRFAPAPGVRLGSADAPDSGCRAAKQRWVVAKPVLEIAGDIPRSRDYPVAIAEHRCHVLTAQVWDRLAVGEHEARNHEFPASKR